MSSPHILFITCHDLGRHLGCYGVPSVRTPTLDALAADGIRLTNHFATSPGCSPSRAAIATGRYAVNGPDPRAARTDRATGGQAPPLLRADVEARPSSVSDELL